MTAPRREAWDRLEAESPKAFAAFTAYLNLPRPDRSILAAYRARSGRLEAENLKPPGTWYRWAERHDWDSRSRSFDAAMDRKAEQGLAGRRLKSLVEVADLGALLRTKASAAARMLASVTQRIGQMEGKDVWIMEVKLSPSEIVQMARIGTELEQLALGLPTERTSRMDGGADQVVITVEAAKEEMKRRLDEVRERQNQANAIAELVKPPKRAG